jgi:hypothetical protein
MTLRRLFAFAFTLALFWGIGLVGFRAYSWTRSNSLPVIQDWFRRPETRPGLTTILTEPCPGAPFLLPSTGLVGLLYADPAAPYNVRRRHTGIDVFGDGPVGEIPVVAAYEGFLTRKADWRSTVIIRHDDPLQPGRTIWTYYTHMADRSGQVSFVHRNFPPGTSEQFVTQGQILGYQGEYGGSQPIGLHVHMSIVKSNANGQFLNEAVLENTLDPSPYFGIDLDARHRPPRPVTCKRST